MKTEEIIELEQLCEKIHQTCNNQLNCQGCPYRYDNNQCSVMVLTTCEDAPCDW